ncbi:fructose-specific PTS transporter subunit EIIC [Arthrobacter sp. APC 3897]|uniref:PTS fructose transporter subunit IIC n=1 Tax=Arthrobacter sp. APC 3897 TaxID=3035204 RepID=UPI0025B52120|nr:fructose-specific PTS transporter subunit EIIC [Arthrobacter sp. APC 3897]MDN3481320.1 fructose-specific PTS transporter subunit EIIC [Arthrobacter sp. APC 3897]
MAPIHIVAATGCPTGIAHTFMAQEALQQAAERLGVSIKVETHGQVGIENALTAEEIAAADGVIIAADKDVNAARFDGKRVVDVGVKAGISRPDALIQEIIDGTAPVRGKRPAAPVDAAETEDHSFFGDTTVQIGAGFQIRDLYKHLMNGVSYMLPFVVGGGVLVALSFLWGIYSADPEHPEQYNEFAAMLNTIGGTAMGLMVPVLSAFIADSIGKRPALVVGLITGLVASNGGTGFLGGIITGFLSGYGMLLLAKLLDRLPRALGGLKAIFIFPVLGTFIFGSITYLIASPMKGINASLQDFLSGFQDSNPILLGLIIGAMCAFDMGGPVNKAAYVTGVALLGDGNFFFMAAVSAACITPPLVTGFAALFFRKAFDPKTRDAAYVNFALGATHITEGAIPFAARNPLLVIPILMVSSAVSAILTFLFQVQVPAPHGGFLVLPVVTNGLQWVGAILAGSILGGLIYGYAMQRRTNTAQVKPSIESEKEVLV